MPRKHPPSSAAVALALTLLGCDQSVTGPELTLDVGPPLAIQQLAAPLGASVAGGTCIAPGSAVSWWSGEDNFDDVAGTNPIARNNGVSFAPGVVGQGFRFDQGLGHSYLEIDDSPDLRPATFTVDFWAQRFGPGQNNDPVVGNILVQKGIVDHTIWVPILVSYFISWRRDDRIAAGLYFEDDVFAPGDTPLRLVGSSVHPFGSVVHVALSFDGTTATLYVNGTAEDTFDATGRPPVAYGEGSVVIGAGLEVARRFGFPRSPDGIIDEVEIFDFALTPDQIQEIHDTGGACKLPHEPPLHVVDVDIRLGSDNNPINLNAGGGKSAKSEKGDKSGKNDKKSKNGKSGKSGKNDKKSKNGKSGKSGHGNANIPVAVLTTDDFDASTIDVSTLTLGDDDEDVVGVTVKKNGTFQVALEDVDDDGDLDLVMHFRLEALVSNGELTEETTRLCLNGATSDGVQVHGCDAVTVLTTHGHS